jgi:hypothetical protein
VYFLTKDFLDKVIEDQKILDIGLKQSRQNKKERTERFPTAEERWPRKGIVIEKEKTLHELLMEGFEEEQRQRELEEEDE